MLARDVNKTYKIVMSAAEEILESECKLNFRFRIIIYSWWKPYNIFFIEHDNNFIEDALNLPIDKQYQALL